ncbi:hypothetical protein acsn021_16370 [Anaerocolumna cellulosilytica]|uniref:Uncharacterized protein n=1 Tax=Anaerocolumna cellulosilytica TaxID=433286 RepID=A0A6S6R4T0_9FIRM|nr:AraC family transcriptional regulator [Anaerocolumna cellulosilytica]MBB5197261.1 AraC-like DNA-binding protein [Anaerocolumna cellulosilytica]BCJ94068.1 hypothetical protein acsn021_16370 [Anaerocolumna cellulosilytica]
MGNRKETVAKIIDYIEEHLQDNLDLDEIAKQAGYSKYHLERIFAKENGSTIYQYIKKRRLTEAARQLVFTDKPIIEIAFGAKYESQQAFTHAFRTLYQVTPQIYRENCVFLPVQRRAIMEKTIKQHTQKQLKQQLKVYFKEVKAA